MSADDAAPLAGKLASDSSTEGADCVAIGDRGIFNTNEKAWGNPSFFVCIYIFVQSTHCHKRISFRDERAEIRDKGIGFSWRMICNITSFVC